MDSIAPISVRVGKAVLTTHGLYVDDRKADIQDLSQFRAFVLGTQALIAQTLCEVFSADTGELFKDGHRMKLVAGRAPWDQYVHATLSLDVAPEFGDIVVGWCVLLTLLDRASPVVGVCPEAVLLASYIASHGASAMSVDPGELRAWLAWTASKNLLASDIEQLRHEDLKPVNPYRNQRSVAVPWVGLAGQFSPFDFIQHHHSDIFFDLKDHIASFLVANNYVYGQFPTDQLFPQEPGADHLTLTLVHNGAAMRFRVGKSLDDKIVLRLLSATAFHYGEYQ